MRLILFDREGENRLNFHPLSLSRPIFALRCGMTSLAEKLIAKLGNPPTAFFVPSYMAEVYRQEVEQPVNDSTALQGDDLLLLDGRVKAAEFSLEATGPSCVMLDDDGEVLCARIPQGDLCRLNTDSLENLLASAKARLPVVPGRLAVWNYTWDLVLANAEQIKLDFAAAGRWGVEGRVEEPTVIRGEKRNVYIAPGAVVHPMVVIDAEHGPVYIDEGAVIHPFTRLEGPCYIGRCSMLLGCKCREGNSIGPYCRVGGEVEESIIHGYSNKYHDGFLGHAYVGQWVNLGALTTNSDLKNDYSDVSVILDGRTPINTGSTKVGALIGDHAKTSIGVLLNTGAYLGAMTVVATNGKLLPKFLPSFGWYIEGAVTKGFGKAKLYQTAKVAMGRRGCSWNEAQQTMWDAIYEITAPTREEAVRRGRKQFGGT